MKQDIWGKHAWIFLHTITLEYPENPSENTKNAIKTMIESLVHLLPCKICQENLSKKLSYHPLTNDILSNKKKLIVWMIDLHNLVNKDIGKKVLTHNEALKYLFKDLKKNTVENYNKMYYIVIGILLIVLFSIAIIFFNF